MNAKANEHVEELHTYLHPFLSGHEQNQLFGHGGAYWILPRDILQSIGLLAGATADNAAKLADDVEGNIMLAQSTGLITAEVADKALGILDKIKDDWKD